MDSKGRKFKARKLWIETYKILGSVSKTARRCGIPRSTLYRWSKRYEEFSENGLIDKSQKPIQLAQLKVTTDIEQIILSFREKHKFGPQRISTHLLREHHFSYHLQPSGVS